LLIGRITDENLSGFWPNQPPNPMTDARNRVEKFVASRNPDSPLPWQHSTRLTGDATEAVAELKREHETTLVIFGSGQLVRELIDELVLMVHPIFLGTRLRLFDERSAHMRLVLNESMTTATGVSIGTYRPAP
jgi:dihydrofolate reductase